VLVPRKGSFHVRKDQRSVARKHSALSIQPNHDLRERQNRDELQTDEFHKPEPERLIASCQLLFADFSKIVRAMPHN
jgi:hypothetical protein